MKKIIAVLSLICSSFLLPSCEPQIEENAIGWTFCSCISVQLDIKSEIATEIDPKEREILEQELVIMEKECGDFLLQKDATPEELAAHQRKQSENCN